MSEKFIEIEGARQNNLKNLNLKLPLNELIVVTGVSGSGKSSLAFDTIYSEGQRRYVETFSPYARQFLDRMDKPNADRISGIPPAIAIDQTNPVRTSRSTVGTMTELNDHLKLLFARGAKLHCDGCGKAVSRDTPESVFKILSSEFRGSSSKKAGASDPQLLITFPVDVPKNFTKKEVKALLEKQGYTRFTREKRKSLEVIQDRVRLSSRRRSRIVEGIEAAFRHGHGKVNVYIDDGSGAEPPCQRYSSDLHCAECDHHFRDPVPNHFSFNSPIGACETCRGFGRVIGIDYSLVVPDERKTLAEGAIVTWRSKSYNECQQDLMRFAKKRRVATDLPWCELRPEDQEWVLEGEGEWGDGAWYGVRRFFKWLESRSYRMHVRVLLSRYRAYRPCTDCQGARLKPESLLWRVGKKHLSIHDVMLLPIEDCKAFFEQLKLPSPLDEATKMLLDEIRTRLQYLVEVGLGYLTLDRQSRTLSGGEVQRINLTTALGTSLVNTLFVLDEPSIGLHSRDIKRLIGVLKRLKDAGNTLVVVEHDPEVIQAADRVLDMGPGPGEHGGEIMFFGRYEALLKRKRSLTAQYLTGKRTVDSSRRCGSPAQSKGSGPDEGRVTTRKPRTLEIKGARANNLKNIDARFPLNQLVCITGVSGSGKSTLIQDICYPALLKLMHRPKDEPGAHRSIRGHEAVTDVFMINQSPIGKTTRSNPASYVGAFSEIRKVFGDQRLAQTRGYTPGTFSFNSGNGRCPNCQGNGFEHIEMQFLSDVYIRCSDCNGTRYRKDILDVRVQGAQFTQPKARSSHCGGQVVQGSGLGEKVSGSAVRGRNGGGDRGSRKKSGKGTRDEGMRTASIADVLEMTVSEACEFFAGFPAVLRDLEPLQRVGLGYLRIGQPVPTLSGGEAQRLKLAGHLAKARSSKAAKDILFLFDEPTTGLHFDDIAVLVSALRELVEAGHSVIVIEHNLDVILASDWIIDLGPEGGAAGGSIVCSGDAATVMNTPASHTGICLKRYLRDRHRLVSKPGRVAEKRARYQASRMNGDIQVHGAREHNLKAIDVRIPRDALSVITGVSGSGKSTLAFDILFAEGQRRYLESLNAYARQFVQPAAKPDVDSIVGIPPTVAIEQRTSRGGRKSTVATVTEIYHFLRLLFVKLGVQHCPDCHIPIQPQTAGAIVAQLLESYAGQTIEFLAPLVVARKGYYTDLAKWARGKGYEQLRVDGTRVATASWPRLDRFKEHDIELPIGVCKVEASAVSEMRAQLDLALEHGNGVATVLRRKSEGKGQGRPQVFSTQRACPACARSFEELDPRLFSYNSKHGWCERCFGTGELLSGFDSEQTGEEVWWNESWGGGSKSCPSCDGHRLRPEALQVKFYDENIADFAGLSVESAARRFKAMKLVGREDEIARDILAELGSRLRFLMEVGLSYLSLDRGAPTLSGGEARRVRLAAQLGSNLRGVCYILDEPSIGLHARDNEMLLATLGHLREKGNTVVVVEHDEETIRRADHVIDLGPGAGVGGGRVVGEGRVSKLLNNSDSVTGHYLKHPLKHPLVKSRAPVKKGGRYSKGLKFVEIRGLCLHNVRLRGVRIPLNRFVCVSGVSGSGKSTVVRHVLYENLKQLLSTKRGKSETFGCAAIEGWKDLSRVLEVDQTPIGKTSRSCPGTYVKFWDDVRKLFATTTEARIRGYTASRFSFNTKGGRCDTCAGVGEKRIEMSFLPDVTVACESCAGARFNTETLEVLFHGKNIGEVLQMSVDEATGFFAAHEKIHRSLQLMQDVGLGYLRLGQQSQTLSGGEAQRIKLVTELSRTRDTVARDFQGRSPAGGGAKGALYILDEPTIGLHMADVEKLIQVLHRLIAVGNSVLIIEHNLDVIAEADWVIDMGPEGGDAGGRIVAQGSPEDLASMGNGSHTGRYLEKFLGPRAESSSKV
jgi:excinuclease ABC subunit A